MIRIFAFFIWMVVLSLNCFAYTSEFDKYFKIDMNMEIPDVEEYMNKLDDSVNLYDRGYYSRYEMGNMFRKDFSLIIKYYGLSENRIKSFYEDELLDVINMLPKEMYQYIGPMLHNIPGMSEKILNLPGIKETKNQFPKDVADRLKDLEGIEYISPALYVVLMPALWREEKMDKPQVEEVNEEIVVEYKPKINEVRGFLDSITNGGPKNNLEENEKIVKYKTSIQQQFGLRTTYPSLTSTLTTKDVEAFVSTIDELYNWAKADNYAKYSQLIIGEYMLNEWEKEHKTALPQNDLKDLVNPCQRIVVKTKFSGLYTEFAEMVSKQGLTPEEWGYVCDRTIKAFRVSEVSPELAYSIKMHRNGSFDKDIALIPKRWRQEMKATQTALVRMYVTREEDLEAVQPQVEIIREKMNNMDNVFLTAPIFY